MDGNETLWNIKPKTTGQIEYNQNMVLRLVNNRLSEREQFRNYREYISWIKRITNNRKK